MKQHRILAVFIIFFYHVFAYGQNIDDDTAALVPVPLATAIENTEPPALHITEADILKTRTLVRPEQKITIQELVPQEITPLPESPARLASPQKQENRQTRMIPHRMSMLSCNVYHDDAEAITRTLLKWTSQGKTSVEFYEAWSNIDFRHLTQVTTFEKEGIRHNVMFGIGFESSAKATEIARRFGRTYAPPTIPELPKKSTTTPTFVVTKGTPGADDLATIEGLHELYQKHHADFIAESKRIARKNAREAAKRKANPPDPTPDVLIRFWTPEKPISPAIATESASAKQNSKGGAK